MRIGKSALFASVACVACAAGASAVQSASATPEFAPHPSVGWVAAAPEYMEPPTGQGPVPVDPGHRRVSNDDFRASGAQPSFPIADLSSPLLQPWVRDQMRPYNEAVIAGKSMYSRQASCWPIGTPGFLLYPVQPVYFVQSPKEVLMIWQADHQIRHVYLDVPHSKAVKPSWYGESVGHYEGDTLVVDTVGVDTRTYVDNYRTPHTEKLHTVERFHMTNGGKVLEVNLHVEDPGAFTKPWNAMQRYKRVEPSVADVTESNSAISSTSAAGPILESSCAENPNALFGAKDAFPIPQTKAPDF